MACRYLAVLPLLAFALVPGGVAAAQDGDAVIVVRGDGLADTPAAPAYATIKIPREVIVTTASGRLEDALSSVAGFQQFRRSDSRSANPSAQGATLRALGGNAASRALVLLDGVPLGDPFFGYIPFSAVAPERLASIAVTRGGGSGPFGSGALAGTIRLESADAATLGPLNASALVNNRGESELSARLHRKSAMALRLSADAGIGGRAFLPRRPKTVFQPLPAPGLMAGPPVGGWCSPSATRWNYSLAGLPFAISEPCALQARTMPFAAKTRRCVW